MNGVWRYAGDETPTHCTFQHCRNQVPFVITNNGQPNFKKLSLSFNWLK